jgi:Protein of unknown function (DUF2778)
MWQYSQSTGKLTDPQGSLAGVGYSGNGTGLNEPDYQSIKNHGPIPQGDYTIGPAYSDSEKGPSVLPLTPNPTNEMFGRSGFLIHGDLIGEVGKFLASDGCIILAHDIRQAISDSADRALEVVV